MVKRQFFLYFAAVGILVVSALFGVFILNRPRCYPKNVMKMSSTDMRLASSVSSFWCEALVLSSDHPFLAFRLSKEPSISPTSLSRNEVDLKLTLKLSQMHHVQYYLLPGTLMTIVMCSTHPGATIYVLRGSDIKSYEEESTTFASDEKDEDSSEDDDDYSEELNDSDDINSKVITITRPNILRFQEIPAGNIDDADCELSPINHLFQLNITASDTYFVIVHHKGPALKNFVKIRLFLDRTSYSTDKYVRSVHVCSGGIFLSSSCSVPLDFLSEDRVLIKVPGEPGAGLTTFKVRSSCKPRYYLVTVILITVPFLIVILSLLFAICMRQSIIRNRLSKRHQDIISTLSSPLLETSAGEGQDSGSVERNVVPQKNKLGDGPNKEVDHPMEFPLAVYGHDDQTAQEVPDDLPPSYKSMYFAAEDITK